MAKHKGHKKAPAPKKPPLTHFLCLPLINAESKPVLKASLKLFQDAVCVTESKVDAEVEGPGESEKVITLPVVHPKAIRPVGALHLTLGVMSLNSTKLSEAVDYLKGDEVLQLLKGTLKDSSAVTETNDTKAAEVSSSSLDPPITRPSIDRKPSPFRANLKGVHSMHPPHKTSILYIAPQDSTDRLYPFCVSLQKLFKDKGFLVEDDRQLKLHATIVNTIYAKGRRRPMRQQSSKGEGSTGDQDDLLQGHGPNANAPLRIDATAILEKFKEFAWAENVALDRVAICEMGAKKVTDAEGTEVGAEYTEAASISLLP